MTHPRVTPEGQVLGKLSAWLEEAGMHRLQRLGLDKFNPPKSRAEMCSTCACRPDTVPNGCLQTQLDFLKAVIEGRPFLCHAPADGSLCKGWMRARAAHVANPIPAEIQAIAAAWEYSPPDEPNEVQPCVR